MAKAVRQVIVIGAGLAGLSAAVRLAERGLRVTVYEAAMQAGGRCRSYFDPVLGMVIDNGNHFVVTGNAGVADYLKLIGSGDRLRGLGVEGPAFHDLRDGSTWTLRPNDGLFPSWILDPKRRVKATRATDYLALAALLFPPKGRTIGQVMSCHGLLWDRLLGPFLLGALNTEPRIASATLASAVIRKTFARGGRAYRPCIAHPTLAAAFVDPAIAFLASHKIEVRLGARARSLTFTDRRVTSIAVGDSVQSVGNDTAVILATPPWIAQELVPRLTAPNAFSSIVNAHFQVRPPRGAPPMLGVIGGSAEWVFAFEDRLSVTVSGADHIIDANRQSLAQRFWSDVAAVHGLGPELPPWQIVKERRATFQATPEQDARRPRATTVWNNLFLAGDWTQTGLPATIEGALQSGVTAARLAVGAGSGS